MSDKIHHIAVQVDDIGDAVDWYTQSFDVEVSYQDESWAMLEFDNLSLALVLPGEHPGHFAVTNDHAEKYGSLTTHRDGTASVYIKDPFGNAVELIREQSA
ncbi:MAG: VOC family protein [Gammaproteobacteria bacterium]|nr:VOC family protein [Gammaproteobacteria bacterium]